MRLSYGLSDRLEAESRTILNLPRVASTLQWRDLGARRVQKSLNPPSGHNFPYQNLPPGRG